MEAMALTLAMKPLQSSRQELGVFDYIQRQSLHLIFILTSIYAAFWGLYVFKVLLIISQNS
jgi:hypothetical protein